MVCPIVFRNLPTHLLASVWFTYFLLLFIVILWHKMKCSYQGMKWSLVFYFSLKISLSFPFYCFCIGSLRRLLLRWVYLNFSCLLTSLFFPQLLASSMFCLFIYSWGWFWSLHKCCELPSIFFRHSSIRSNLLNSFPLHSHKDLI